MGNYKFDIDLPDGEAGENFIKELLTGNRGKIEVKRDFIVTESGNLAIEYRYRGNKSGLAKTEASWWAIILDGPIFNHQLVLFISTRRLKEIAMKCWRKGKYTKGGDNKSSKVILVPLEEFISRKEVEIQEQFIQ